MFSYDPEATNRALAATGSSYQVPVAQPAAQPAPTQPQPAVNVNTAPPQAVQPPPAPPEKKEPEPTAQPNSGGGAAAAESLGDVQGMANAASGMTKDPEKKDGMEKLGGLVGTVLSFYTGNYAGGAQGLQSMKDSGAK